jgi:hypothetical protein
MLPLHDRLGRAADGVPRRIRIADGERGVQLPVVAVDVLDENTTPCELTWTVS